jgi:divalent metal cation (Fe/Co/Zn/Cd) transporter
MPQHADARPLVLIDRPDSRAPIGRRDAVRRAVWLTRATICWNVGEGVVAVSAGAVAGSVSLVGFGLDSAIEVSAALVLAWRLRHERRAGCKAAVDRRATRLIGLAFVALAVYVSVQAGAQLATARPPESSAAGIALAALSLAVMPALARAKARLGPALGSTAVASEARQTLLCAWLSAVLLAGLLLNALVGWWWADPVAALGVAGIAIAEAVRAWRAESLDDTCCG